jgi:hypothetical protein
MYKKTINFWFLRCQMNNRGAFGEWVSLCGKGIGSAYGIRTHDLVLERDAS